jgi:hypothetical protein
MPVDTKKVRGRRTLEYASLQDLLADAERLSKGKVKALGNWSPGQVFAHLATTMNNSIDGSPFVVPWYFRIMARAMKNMMLRRPMTPGFQLPASAAQLIPGPTSTEDGLSALRRAIARQEKESHRAPNPALGTLTRAEWDKLHLLHANLHMSFLVPQD